MDRTRRIPLLLVVLVGVLALGGPASQAAPATRPAAAAVPGELLVGFRGDVSAADQKSIFTGVGATDTKDCSNIDGALLPVGPDPVGAPIATLERQRRI